MRAIAETTHPLNRFPDLNDTETSGNIALRSWTRSMLRRCMAFPHKTPIRVYELKRPIALNATDTCLLVGLIRHWTCIKDTSRMWLLSMPQKPRLTFTVTE